MICLMLQFLLFCMCKNLKKNTETDINPLWQTMISSWLMEIQDSEENVIFWKCPRRLREFKKREFVWELKRVL